MIKKDVEFIKRRNENAGTGKKVDYVPVVLWLAGSEFIIYLIFLSL